jgi:phosphomevalonate kinase
VTGHAVQTLTGAPVVAAPGKVFLVGEYAVLEGGPAVLAAVSRYALAQYVPGQAPTSPVVAETLKRAVALLADTDMAPALPPGAPLVDTAAFRQGPHKLGLGSSAAAAVAAAGAVLSYAGVDITARRDLLFTIADEGHRAAQGGLGSGADIAAAVHGAFVGFVRPGGGAPIVRRLSRPDGLAVVVFWSGSSSSTPQLVQAVRALRERDAGRYGALMGELRQRAEQFAHAFLTHDARGSVRHADAYGQLLEKLGASAEVPIITPPFAEAAAVARSLGGAAKPSGAGGGDVGVALFADDAAAAAFTRRCPPSVSVLDVTIDPDGARRRHPGTVELT